jgi:hypothetical protein
MEHGARADSEFLKVCPCDGILIGQEDRAARHQQDCANMWGEAGHGRGKEAILSVQGCESVGKSRRSRLNAVDACLIVEFKIPDKLAAISRWCDLQGEGTASSANDAIAQLIASIRQ